MSPVASSYDESIYASDNYIYIFTASGNYRTSDNKTFTKISMSTHYKMGAYAGNGVFYFSNGSTNYK